MFEVEFELVSVDDVKHMLKSDTAPVFHKTSDPFKALRRKEATMALQGYAIAWMAKLPPEKQPRACANKYPRIVNKLAAIWDMPEKANEYLRDLVVDKRGGVRQGFPMDVQQELQNLRGVKSAKLVNDRSAWALEPLSRS
jgi:hypothetical protein